MTTLSQLCAGDRARVICITQGALSYRRRLLALGITPEITLTVLRVAPLGDPVQIFVRGSNLSLRHCEANMIEVEKIQ